jgi:formimidoylglutamate deiminase
MLMRLSFEYALIGGELRHRQALVIDEAGAIAAIEDAGTGADGFCALPGMPNAHSHAFQRALAGFGERAGGGEASFWGWREAMYRLANRITPEEMSIVARRAFAEMLAAGFTSVAEFHYIHHLPDGGKGPEMGRALIEAAEAAGIRLRLLPVFYRTGGFGKDAAAGQRRFIHDNVAQFCRLLEQLTGARLGVAPHSLRAVPPEVLPELIASARILLGDDTPIHIHISEQSREVEECRAAYGCSPIELLARTVALDANWNLVHATHASAAELEVIRRSGARVVLCPLTEAYLGDGLFPAAAFKQAGGQFAVGSDSNCRIDAVEETRCLEFGQRLKSGRRPELAGPSGLGATLWTHLARAGAKALGEPAGEIAVGRYADLVVLKERAAPWLGHGPETLLDALVIGASRAGIADVYVGGRRLVAEGRHINGAGDCDDKFAAAVKRLSG